MLRKWTKEEFDYLAANYATMNVEEIAMVLNRSVQSIHLKANRNGLAKPKLYFYDKRFFKDIDTEEKAYWLGFIYADGCVSHNKNKRNHEVSISLKESDYHHLEKFNDSINGNVGVSFVYKKDSLLKDGRTIKGSTVGIIRLYSSDMVNDLISHGVIPNKSLIKDAPIGVPEHLMCHFLRGYFDGNGTICYSYTKAVDKYYIKVAYETGSIKFANWLCNTIKSIGFDCKLINDKNAYKIQLKGSKQDKHNYLHYLYKNSNIYLDRKYEKYLCAVSE